MTAIFAIQCNKCKDIIYSRARRDFHFCSCESIAIDGGFEYHKITGIDYSFIALELKATKQQLYDDWNKSKDKYGVISYGQEVQKLAGKRNKADKLPLAPKKRCTKKSESCKGSVPVCKVRQKQAV